MIIRKKKKPLLIIILAAVLAIAVAAAVIIGIKLTAEDTTDRKDPPQIIEGVEALYNGSAVAYEHVSESDMTLIRIVGSEHEYALMREETDDGSLGSFLLYYRDINGDLQIYYPAITEYDPTFEYDDLYATVAFGDYGNIPILTYLGVALGTTYFDERIEVSEYIEEQDIQLKNYGLSSDDDFISITFKYNYQKTDENGEAVLDEKGNPVLEEGTRRVKIGEPLVSGGGYYFMVDGRNYVYSTTNNYFDYAFLGFTELIDPVLTAAGLEQDSAFEPYLTTDFKQWKNEVHKTEGEKIPEGATVIVNADAITPAGPSAELGSDEEDGYLHDGYTSLSFDFSLYTDGSAYEHFINTLLTKEIGKYDEPFSVTLSTYSNTLSLVDGKATVSYKIVAIESLIRDTEEITEKGTPVGDDTLLKVTYYLTNEEGRVINYNPLHAVIDLTSPLVPEEVVTALKAEKIGTLSEQLDFTMEYTEENSVRRNVKMIISEIISITDEDNAAVAKVANGTTVIFRYYLTMDGKRVEGDHLDKISVSSSLTGDSKAVADALMGRTQMGDLALEVVDYTEYCEIMADFICYEIKEVEYFVTKRLIVSFEFEQASKRDPYYGESLYKNTTDNENKLYALNAASCEAVIKILGGIGDSTTASSGLIGSETVAIGLTPEIMEMYGLYAYSLYFELPRGITNVVYDDSDQTLNEYLNTLDDYTYYSTLGFTLYASEELRDEDGSKIRYIASDMYDLVAKVPAEDFVFLNYEFVDFYARRNIVLTDVSNIKTITMEFMMDDIYGKYVNELTHTVLYAYNGKVYSAATLPEDAWSTASEFDGIQVFVSPVGDCSPNALIEFMNKNGYTEGVSLYELYGKKYQSLDTLGTANFKEFTETLFYTYYSGVIAPELQEEYLSSLSPIMRMTVTLGKADEDSDGAYKPTSAYDYVYEFYRYSDGCVMVRVFRQHRTTGSVIEEVSDFYISLFSFKKIVSAYSALLAGEDLNNDLPYVSAGDAAIVDIYRDDERI